MFYKYDMKKKLSPEQEALLNKFKNNGNDNSIIKTDNNEKAKSNVPKPQIRRSGSRGK
jgi:hypothetical protein